MLNNLYSKTIEELTESDLNDLIDREISEGYWVEYKREFQTPKKIAKSIASFANSYGGWYFLGVEADKTRNIAIKICGFSLDEFPNPVDSFRESVKANIDPVPFFIPKLVEIGDNKAVLVVYIPDNQETPFINKDGRIYRRISDSSDPIPEDNRFAIDRLYDNGKELGKRFDEFCKDDRVFSKVEENQGWVNIYLSPYPLGFKVRDEMLYSQAIYKLLEKSQEPQDIYLDPNEKIGSGYLPFNSGQMGVQSIILKQVTPEKLPYSTITAELFFDGKAKIFIPLEYVQILKNINQLKSQKVIRVVKNLQESDKESDFYLIRFFDLKKLFAIVTNLLNYYQKWYYDNQLFNSLRFAISLENIWRVSPFVDSDEWGSFTEKYGLPIQHVNSLRIPNQRGKGIIINEFPLWTTACPLIATGFGIPLDIYTKIAFSY